MDLARPPEGATSHHLRGFGYPDALAACILCMPIAILLVQQALNLGLLWSLGGVIPVSDANGWVSCSSTVLTSGISSSDAWCWRRPLGALVFIPYLALAPSSLAAALVLQMIAVCTSAWIFVVALRRTFPVNLYVTLGVAVALCVPIIWYGGSFGIEGAALALSLLSAAAFTWFLKSHSAVLGILSPVLLILAFQVRPGNILLTATLVAVVAMLFFRSGRWPSALAAVALAIATWVMPNLLFQSLGIENAGNSANFWATTYSAVTPDQDTWLAAYERFATPSNAMGESNEFAMVVRDATFAQLARDPSAFVAQAVTNLSSLARHGFITLALGLPEGPFDVSPDSATSVVYLVVVVITWSSSLAFVALLVAGTVVLFKSHTNMQVKTSRQNSLAVIILGWATILGATGFFVVVGHDERTRHLVQNVPWILLVVAVIMSLLCKSPTKSAGEHCAPRAISRVPTVMLVGTAVALVLLAAAMVVEGHRQPEQLMVQQPCAANAVGQMAEIVAAVPTAAHVQVPSSNSWRTTGRPARSVEGTDLGWIAGAIADLRPGLVVSLRTSNTGVIFGAVAPEGVSLGDPSPWCLTRSGLTVGERMLSVLLLEREDRDLPQRGP